MTDAGIASYYDRLTRWTSMARSFGYGGGRRSLTVHRALVDPRADGRPTTTRLHDLVFELLSSYSSPHVLDAGCGLGGTMIDLAPRLGGEYTGLTLSASQAAVAEQAVEQHALSDRVQLLIRSYDHPPSGPFDIILAIEALAHSPDPAASLDAFRRVLAPDGAILIVDDMPEPAARDSGDLAAFQRGWRCPVLWGRERYVSELSARGFQAIIDRDLTDDFRPRTLSRIRMLQAVNRLACSVVPFAGFADVMDSHHGGLALERLLSKRLVRYRMILAKRL